MKTSVILIVLAGLILGFVAASFWTWLIMLAVGAVGGSLGFWSLFPAGLLLTLVISAVAKR